MYDGEVERRVEEREQAEHPAVLNDDVPAGEPPERRDRERQQQELERPAAGLELNGLGGIRAEARGPAARRSNRLAEPARATKTSGLVNRRIRSASARAFRSSVVFLQVQFRYMDATWSP